MAEYKNGVARFIFSSGDTTTRAPVRLDEIVAIIPNLDAHNRCTICLRNGLKIEVNESAASATQKWVG